MFLKSPLLKVGLEAGLFIGIFLMPLPERHAIAKSWQGIVPLHSSRSDVYGLLGNPTRVGKYTATFELQNEIVEFIFAKGGSCGTTLIDSWHVARDTVINIRVVPKKEVSFENRRSFVKSQDPTQTHVFHYSDWDEGVRYTVENQNESERVVSIDYFESSEDRILSCSNPRQAESTPIFEQYGLISLDQENAILDNFAIQLLDDPNLTGKVILRRGKYSQKFAVKKLLHIKNYLYQQRHVPANRVSAFELHSGRDYTVELYLVSKALGPKGKPRPGKPEGVLPDLETIKKESGKEREAPPPIPSTIRSQKNPLQPWNGRA